MEEAWKSVVGYEGLYQVSNLGRIKSLDRFRVFKNGIRYNRKGRTLKLVLEKKGYFRVNLFKEDIIVKKLVHRLVACAFIPNPENKEDINHIDNIRNNNIVSNLEWCTRKENLQHASKQGRMKGAKGIKHHNNKLSEKDVINIRNCKQSRKNISFKYKISVSTVQDIQSRRTWKWL